jgi:mRNA interferase RelE/StbE
MKPPVDIRARIEAGLSRLAQDGTGDVRKLSGEPGFRLRVGEYRVIFTETSAAIEVRAAGHRREIYR